MSDVALALGTAQLGLPYGKVRPSQPPSEADAFAVLDAAIESGFTAFDTARAYGGSEALIGRWVARRGHLPRIVSKAMPLDASADPEFINAELRSSLDAINVHRLDAYLFHRSSDLHRDGAVAAMTKAVGENLIGGFGVSVYDREELLRALEVGGVTDIQVPFSLVDRRSASEDLFIRAETKGTRIWVRSIFLQGVLLMRVDEIPAFLSPLKPVLTSLNEIANGAGCSLPALLMAAAKAEPGVHALVIGAHTPAQVKALAADFHSAIAADVIAAARASVNDLPVDVIDPRRWPGQHGVGRG
jgi:aryl-alcohol dehydrogenase-like predicted oxidoreductase